MQLASLFLPAVNSSPKHCKTTTFLLASLGGREGVSSGNRLSSFLLCCQELLFLRIEVSPHLVDLNKESLM